MDEVIHINIGASKTETHFISSTSVRIWAHLLTSNNWIISNPIPGNWRIQHGLSMTIINNLAIATEGFVADIIAEYLRDRDDLKITSNADLDKLTWWGKKKLYNELFSKKLEDYPRYEGITALINFRNNLSHGRTYTEYSARQFDSNESSEIESDNKVYQDLREYLIRNNLLSARKISSNVEVPWKIETACHFGGIVKFFMHNILRENESKNNIGIETEYKLAYNIN